MKKKISKKNDISRSSWAEKAKWWMDQLSQIIEAKSITRSGFDLMIKRLTSTLSYHWTTRTHIRGWFIQYWYILIHSYPQRQRKNGIMACYLSLTHSQAHTHIQLPFFPFWLLRTHMVKLRSTLRNSQISKRDSSMLFMSFSWIIGPIKNVLCPRFELVLHKLYRNTLTTRPTYQSYQIVSMAKVKQVSSWRIGSALAFKLEKQWFLPQTGAFFCKKKCQKKFQIRRKM